MTCMRLGLIAVLAASLGSIPPASRADGPPAGEERDPVAAARPAERPPRKVIIGTVIFGPYGAYPGLEQRLEVLGDLIDRMARQAAEQYPGRRLDLAILPETTVTSTHGKAQERAVPLRGRVREAFGALARKHRTYIIAPMDLAEDGRGGTSCSNAAVLFDRKGEVAGIYRKRHPVASVGHDDLEGGIEPGRDCPVFDCDFGRLGIQICWDIQYPDGWDALARGGAEIVAWPTASPATVLPASNAARHRYYVVSSTWRDNATVYEPTGMVAARIEGSSASARVLIHQVDLSYAILGWSGFLKDGMVLREKYGDRVGFHYDRREDMGLFWSNDPATTIGAMIRSIGGEGLDAQVARDRRLQEAARGSGPGSR
jgi:predicted amidohydrolase